MNAPYGNVFFVIVIEAVLKNSECFGVFYSWPKFSLKKHNALFYRAFWEGADLQKLDTYSDELSIYKTRCITVQYK